MIQWLCVCVKYPHFLCFCKSASFDKQAYADSLLGGSFFILYPYVCLHMSVTNSVLIPQPANVIAMKGGHGRQLRRRSLLYYSSSKFVRSVKERSYIIISFPRSGATIPQQICKYCTAPAELWTLGLHCEL